LSTAGEVCQRLGPRIARAISNTLLSLNAVDLGWRGGL
jgi:hypothetical protein